jgi:hypothetical protein
MMTKGTFFTSIQLHFARLFLVTITPLQRYHAKILVLSGIFIFQIILLLQPAQEAKSSLYTWNPSRIYHSHLGSNGTHTTGG